MILTGFSTLLYKEVVRFSRVFLQTIFAPVISTLLYVMVFSKALGNHSPLSSNISYMDFLLPGLIMMTMLQNAFANTSSSLIQSKVTGNIVFLLLSPISNFSIFLAYVVAALVRALLVGVFVWLMTIWYSPHLPTHFGWLLVFAIVAGLLSGLIGMLVGILSEKFDQIAAVQNFLIMPMTFLAGSFYSINTLSPFWQTVSKLNPFFYLVDGFRYGFIGVSDHCPLTSLFYSLVLFIILSLIAMKVLASGYKMRN